MIRRTLLCILTAAVAVAVAAETVRGPVVAVVTVDSAGLEGVQAELALDEIFGVELDADPRFLEGVEVSVSVPAEVRNQPGSVALSGLVSVSPRPATQVMSLRGARILFEPLLRAQRMYYQIPVFAGARLRHTADTVVLDQIVPPESFPLLLTFTEISKGASLPRDSIRFDVGVRPIVKDKGAVAIRYRNEAGEELLPGDEELNALTVSIDGRTVADDEVVLDTGLHELRIESEVYLEFAKTFGVERGRVSEIVVTLTRPKAQVRLDAPEGAEVFVDGQKVTGRSIELPEGEHVALVRIGDYSVSRRFAVTRKKSYIISVSLDIIVNEVE